MPQWGPGGLGTLPPEADEILASKTPYFALKSVRIDKKNLNTKLPQHESLMCNNSNIGLVKCFCSVMLPN